MAAIHVLGATGNNTYTVVIHATTPAGNNSAGVPWSTAIKNSGRAVSVLTVGTGAGQTNQAEMNAILGGTIIEASLTWGDNPAWTDAQRIADIDLRATQLIAETIENLKRDLKFFGYTRG